MPVFEALGAKPDDFGGGPGDDRFAEDVRSGEVDGAESGFSLAGWSPCTDDGCWQRHVLPQGQLTGGQYQRVPESP